MHLSQDQLADRIGLEHRSIERYESGERDPRCTDLLPNAQASEVPVTRLVDSKERPRAGGSRPGSSGRGAQKRASPWAPRRDYGDQRRPRQDLVALKPLTQHFSAGPIPSAANASRTRRAPGPAGRIAGRGGLRSAGDDEPPLRLLLPSRQHPGVGRGRHVPPVLIDHEPVPVKAGRVGRVHGPRDPVLPHGDVELVCLGTSHFLALSSAWR
ncbi:helix-turn-helix domain-containing protein [Streptomyces subrutilus]|uniref:helix-turn-helix domain-containing protein n=1 Tax=Streptomyces subrutilus TaxID=36818 RepID=UPI001E52413C|nr:helix-turn-helix transcriptional regulator [Streptomyces subrutilus]